MWRRVLRWLSAACFGHSTESQPGVVVVALRRDDNVLTWGGLYVVGRRAALAALVTPILVSTHPKQSTTSIGPVARIVWIANN